MAVLAVWLAAMACNIQTTGSGVGGGPTLSQQEIAGTAAALVLTSQAAGSPSPQPPPPGAPLPTATQCQPIVTANLNANVRVGPSTLYEAIGNLLTGQAAPIAGRNAEGTWWYIDFAAGPGGH